MRQASFGICPEAVFDLTFAGSRYSGATQLPTVTTPTYRTCTCASIRVWNEVISSPNTTILCQRAVPSEPHRVLRRGIRGGNFISPANDALPCRQATILSGPMAWTVWHLLSGHDDANKDKQRREKARGQPTGRDATAQHPNAGTRTLIDEAVLRRRFPRSRRARAASSSWLCPALTCSLSPCLEVAIPSTKPPPRVQTTMR